MKGVTPLISLALTILIVTVSSVIVVTSLIPFLNRVKDSSNINEGISNLEYIYSVLSSIASEAEGSQRIVSLSSSENIIKFDKNLSSIYFDYETKSELELEGRRGNVRLEKSPIFLEYFNSYPLDSNASPTWICLYDCKIDSSGYLLNHSISYHLEDKLLKNFYIESSFEPTALVYGLPEDPNNLVLYFPLDEGTSIVANDFSSQSNNGVLYNGSDICFNWDCPSWVDGISGKALEFDGLNDFIKVNDSSSLNLAGNEITLSFWIKPKKILNDQFVIDKLNYTNEGYGIWITSSQKVRYNLVTNIDSYESESLSSLEEGKWYYVLLTYNGSYINLYINLSLEVSQPAAGNLKPCFGDLFIASNNSNSSFLNATLDEIQIFNSSLSFTQIKTLYELTQKKLFKEGKTDEIESVQRLYLVLSSPYNLTHFYEVKLKGRQNLIRGIIPLRNIEFVENLRVPAGNWRIKIFHEGLSENRKVLIKAEIL